jgi:putative Mg2+ transporter-C (MgtC) family protein
MLTSVDTQLAIVVELFLASILGAIIGWEREIHDHPAGMRTHLLVCVGSAGFTVLSINAFGPEGDPGRVAAQIVSGIGFLGAGAILKEGANIRGLTTAASLWVVAAVGMAVGAGAWIVAIAITVLVVVSLWPLRLVTDRFIGSDDHRVRLQLVAPDPARLPGIVEAVERHGGTIAHLRTQRDGSHGLAIDLEAAVDDAPAGVQLATAVAALDGVRLTGSEAVRD